MVDPPCSLTAEELLADVRWLRHFARRLVLDVEEAEDVAQETWASALRRAPGGIDRRGLRAWLARVARNVAAHGWRDADIRRHHEAQRAREAARFHAGDAASQLEELQIQHRLVGVVLELPEPYRSAVVLRFRRALSYAEMADKLGLAEPAVRKRVSRGVALLRERLARQSGGEGDWRRDLAVFAAAERGRIFPPALRWIPWAVAGALVLGAVALRSRSRPAESSTEFPWSAAAPHERRASPASPEEREALQRLRSFIGCNDLDWGLLDKAVSVRHSFPEGPVIHLSDGLVGWDPAEEQLVFLEFHSDTEEFESMNAGRCWIDETGALRREFQAFEPGGSSLAWRESFRQEERRLEHGVEFLDAAGSWSVPFDLPIWSVITANLGSRATEPGEDPPVREPRRTDEDQQALRGFSAYIGSWSPPGGAGGQELELAWGIEGKTVHMREHRISQGRRVKISEGLVGWHYGLRALVLHEYVRDGFFEAMNSGRVWFEAAGALCREFRSSPADGTSRLYRERFALDGPDEWTLCIERFHAGSWETIGNLRGERNRSP